MLPHPKIKFDEAGTLCLNFGEYGGEIELACFSPCGTRLLTVKEVGVARIWDVESGKQVGGISPQSPLSGRLGVGPTSRPFEVFIESAALDHKGEHALLGLNDGTAGKFRVSDGSRVYLFQEPGSEPDRAWGLIRAVAFSPDGSLGAVGFNKQTLGVWNTNDGSLRRFFHGPRADQAYDVNDGPRPGLVSSVGISADNRYLFAGYADMTGTIWDLQTGEVIADLSAHTDKILALFVEGQLARWVTSGGDVWEAKKGQIPQRTIVTGKRLAEAAFSPNGTAFISRGRLGAVAFSNLQGEQKLLVTDRDDGVSWPETESTLGFDREGRRWFYPVAHNCLGLAGDERLLKLHRHVSLTAQSPEMAQYPTPHNISERIDGLVLSPDGSSGVTLGWSGDLEVWDLRSGQLRSVVREPEHAMAVAISPDSSLLAIGVLGKGGPGVPRHIKILRVSDGQEIARFPGHTHQVHRLEFGPEGTWLVSTGLDRAVRLWSIAEGDLIREITCPDLEFQNLAVLQDGRILVFRSKCIEIWRGLRTRTVTIPLHKNYGQRWAISKDEEVIAATAGTGVTLWSLEDGRLIRQVTHDVPSPKKVPTERLAQDLVPAAGALLWEGPGGNFIHTGDGPRGWVTPLSLSCNGQLTLIPTASGVALIDLSADQNLISVMPFDGRLRASRITEALILAVNSAGTVSRWKLPSK